MATVIPTGGVLGATVEGIDLSQPLASADFGLIVRLLGTHGVLCFPRQKLEPATLKAFSGNFGRLHASTTGDSTPPGFPEVMILSNIVVDGKPIGASDGGQSWHTDMSYNDTIGFINVLHALTVPRRDGKVLGDTAFANMHAAYDALPLELKTGLEGMTITHDFNFLWEKVRSQPGNKRKPLSEEQRRRFPPSVHPVFMTHPITGRKVLYANPGYSLRINEMSESDSRRTLETLFAHQLQPQFQYAHRWTEGDVLVWDHIGTIHMAVPDYGPTEHRHIIRCQVMADKVLDPEFQRSAGLGAQAH